MTITELDHRTALVLIDLQKGILANPSVHPVSQIVARGSALAAAFRRVGLPVVLVRVCGHAPGRTEQALTHGSRPDDWSDLAPELDRQPGDHVIAKTTWGAFSQPELRSILDQDRVTQLVIGGISTSLGVESTARQAYELGYNVTLAIDAMTDRDDQAHQASVEHIFPKLGETGTTDAIIAALPSLGRGVTAVSQ